MSIAYLSWAFNAWNNEISWSTKSKINDDKNRENVAHLELTEVICNTEAHCNIFHSYYQQDSKVLYTFAPNKSFDQLLDISLKKIIFFKSFNSEF